MITTIAMPVSRIDFLHRIFAQLDMMPCNAEETNLLVYVDGDQDLFTKARNFVWESKFKEKLCVYRRKGLPNVNHIRQRRQRIADIHNEMKELVGACDYVFLLEDDTLIPLDTLTKLLKDYSDHPFAGFITGVQVGRWGFTVPGVWKVNNPYDVKEIKSLLPPKADEGSVLQEIDAAGLYCCLIKTKNYKDSNFTPFELILGPDVSLGLYLRMMGYKNYVDWSINTTHLTKRGEIKVGKVDLQQITFTKIDDEKWTQEVI